MKKCFRHKPTIPYNAIIEKAIAGEIKALWVIATNPRHSWVNNEDLEKHVEKIRFLSSSRYI